MIYLLISRWAVGLLKETGHILLDGRSDESLVNEVRRLVEEDADNRIGDLHVWHVGEHASAAIVSLVTHYPRPVAHYQRLLGVIHELKHVAIEVNVCTDPPCLKVNEAGQ